MAVSFVNNANLLSDAFDRISRMNDPQAAALQQFQSAIPATSDAIRKDYTAGQVAKALESETKPEKKFLAASQRAMALGDYATALQYADLYDKSLDRAAQTAFQNEQLRLIGQKSRAEADQKAAEEAAKQAKALADLEYAKANVDQSIALIDANPYAFSTVGKKLNWGKEGKNARAEVKQRATFLANQLTQIARGSGAAASMMNSDKEGMRALGVLDDPSAHTGEELRSAMRTAIEILEYERTGKMPSWHAISPVQDVSKYSGLL